MGLKEDILEIKKEYQEVKEQSLAMELLRDSKETNKRLAISFTIVLCLSLILWGGTTAYLIHTLNDINTEETTLESYDIEQEADGSNNFINGNGNVVENG